MKISAKLLDILKDTALNLVAELNSAKLMSQVP